MQNEQDNRNFLFETDILGLLWSSKKGVQRQRSTLSAEMGGPIDPCGSCRVFNERSIVKGVFDVTSRTSNELVSEERGVTRSRLWSYEEGTFSRSSISSVNTARRTTAGQTPDHNLRG